MPSSKRRFFVVGTTGICIEEISDFWVADGALGGPTLVVAMTNGRLVHLQKKYKTPEAIMAELLNFIERSQ